MPKSLQRCVTSLSVSSNVPSSSRNSIRSRADILPSLCWRSRRAAPPPSSASWLRRLSSAAFRSRSIAQDYSGCRRAMRPLHLLDFHADADLRYTAFSHHPGGTEMIRTTILLLTGLLLALSTVAQDETPDTPSDKNWISVSNNYTQMLLDVEMKHRPESGSDQGLSEYDNKVAQPTVADEDQDGKETEAVVAKLKTASWQQKQPEVAQDLQIILRRVDLSFREEDYKRAHVVPFFNASAAVFSGLHTLLDEQTPNERRPAAVVRIREYAGLEPGYKPLTEICKQRIIEQMAKPGVVYPAKIDIETELGRNSNYLEGITTLLQKSKLTGGKSRYTKL